MWDLFLIQKLLKSIICGIVNSTHMYCLQLTKSNWKKKKKSEEKTQTWVSLQTMTICTVHIQSQCSQLEKRYKNKKLKTYAWTLESAFWSLTEQGQRQRDKGVLIIDRTRTKTTLRSAFWLFIRQRQKQHAWSWLLIFFYKLNLLF